MTEEREVLTESLLMIQNNQSREGLHKCFTQTRYDNSKVLCFDFDLITKLLNYEVTTIDYCESRPKIRKQPLIQTVKNFFRSESEKLAEKQYHKDMMDICLAYSGGY